MQAASALSHSLADYHTRSGTSCTARSYIVKRRQTAVRAKPNEQNEPVNRLQLLQQLGQDQGFRVEVAAPDEEQETWEEAMDEVEDVWMRDPAGESFAELEATAPSDATQPQKAVLILTSEELQAMMAEDQDEALLVIDVRDSTEFQQGHVPEAINVPLTQLDRAVAESWQSKTVVVASSGDTRSQQAHTRLSRVYNHPAVFLLLPDPSVE